MDNFDLILDYFDRKRQPDTPPVAGLPPTLTNSASDLTQARWGIIVPDGDLTPEEKSHLDALTPLIQHRASQQGNDVRHFTYRPEESVKTFLARFEVEPGAMEPTSVPYYLLIVASPTRVSWRFQVLLDAEYAVGRLWFDNPEDTKGYVESLLAAESQLPTLRKDIETLFFAPTSDSATQSSHDNLMLPLLARLNRIPSHLPMVKALDANATHEQLTKLITERSDNKKPRLFFGACHGQESDEIGAWESQGGQIFSSDDISTTDNLSATVFFLFACFSAGVPGPADLLPSEPPALDRPATVALLPQRLLAQGATAFVGHINRAWDYSFLGATRGKPHIQPFSEVWQQIAAGLPVGHAMDYLNQRPLLYLSPLDELRRKAKGNQSDDLRREFTETLWTWHDALYYVVLGDPFAHLNIA
jgi:hypothetical protein